MDKEIEAHKWWNELSINEQKRLTSLHPYYSKFNSMYVLEVKHGITEMFEYFNKKEV